MKRMFLALGFVFGAVFSLSAAETNVVNGMTVVCEGGICRVLDGKGPENVREERGFWENRAVRMSQGYMNEDALLAFIENRRQEDFFAGKALWLILLLALFGGLAMNLTPCVLPMIPINLVIIGKSAVRGAWYGFGIMVAYGVLGILAAVGGLAFGSIQSSPWFNLFVAIVFAVLSLSIFGVFFIDFSKLRSRFRGGAFLMGVLAAVLASACVAPILIAALLLTARLFAAGKVFALGLPFVLGFGMALPWPFVGAGLAVLPKPGAWMKWINRSFGIVVLGFAAWYGRLAYKGFVADGIGEASEGIGDSGNVMAATPSTFNSKLRSLKSEFGKPIFVDCWATWCKNCAAMEKGALAAPSVRKSLERFVVIRLQAEDINELRRMPGFEGVLGLPAFVIFE